MPAESNNPTGLDESVNAIADILEPEEDTPEAEEAQGEEEAPEQSEESEHEDAESGEDEQPEKATLETVEYEGKTYQLPPELKSALLRQQDYTRKTQEVATIRKQVEADQQQYREKSAKYDQGINLLGMLLQQSAPPPPDPALLDTDVVEYMRQERQFKAHSEKLQALGAEWQRREQHRQQEQHAEWQRERQEFARQLPELIPAWKDKARAQREWNELCEHLLANGYSREQIEQATDAHGFAMAYESMQYRKVIAQKQKTTPKAPQVAAPGAKPKTTAKDVDAAKARDRLRKTGRLDDAAAYIEHFL